MLIITRAKDLRSYVAYLKQQGLRIGFVPTMGALHRGHLSLIDQAESDTDVAICSIFVNPKQFNDPEDLKKYPRTFDQDIGLLTQSGCEVLYYPTVGDVFPKDMDTSLDVDLQGLDRPMEGVHRPGHFQGMLEVVKRLLDIVSPHYIYMGQKDFQQFLLVDHMVGQLSLPVEVRMCPIVREPDGLAMSSRNRLLTRAFREKAPILHKTLEWAARQILAGQELSSIENQAAHQIEGAGLRPEYFSVVDADTLASPRDKLPNRLVICTAAQAGDIRLIDNLIVERQTS